MLEFNYNTFLPREIYNEINYIRTYEPQIIISETNKRKKPIKFSEKIVLAAADHNARMINEYKGNKIGLSNRHEYLSRLVRMLFSSELDGVEASPDILEDLIIINYLTQKRMNFNFLENKILIGTVNRGGLKNTVWEMDDMCTCFTVDRINKLNLDGVKFMIRINPQDELSKNTLKYCTQVVNEAENYNLPIFIECLFVVNDAKGGYKLLTDTESLIKSVGVVSSLGCTASQKWLEVPLNNEYKTVTDATTCSILVVPDELMSLPIEVIKEYTKEMKINENVRGILLGRNVMFNEHDPYYMAEAISKVWHSDIDYLTAYEQALKTKVLNIL